MTESLWTLDRESVLALIGSVLGTAMTRAGRDAAIARLRCPVTNDQKKESALMKKEE